MHIMMIDEVDYDSTTPEGQKSIFLQVVKPKKAIHSDHRPEKFRHNPSNRKEGEAIISNKNGESKKRTGGEVKKHAT